jgi:hypothetical protein
MMRSPKSKPKSAKTHFAASPSVNAISDPFPTIGRRATASGKREIKNAKIDRILYGSAEEFARDAR